MIRLRRALPDDATALAQLATRTFTDAFGPATGLTDVASYCAAHYTPRHFAADIADPALITLVADGEALVAFAQTRLHAPIACVAKGEPVRAPAQLSRLYVDVPWHGQGLAQSILRRVLADAARHACDTLWLAVWEHNDRAIAFYNKSGFRIVGEQPFQLGAQCQRDLVMAADVAAALAQD